MSEQPPRQQLEMAWPKGLTRRPRLRKLPPGYELRTFRDSDRADYYRVMGLAGFTGWTDETLKPWLAKVLPDGFFVVAHKRKVVAAAMATHNPGERHPFGGELGWVAGDPAHKGLGLGYTVCAAVMRRFLDAGYSNIYLRTDDFRLPAISIYLKLGFVPSLFAPDMKERWQAVAKELGVDLGSGAH